MADKKPNYNVTNKFFLDNTKEMTIGGKKVRVFKGEVDNVKAGLAKLEAKKAAGKGDGDLAAQLKDAKAEAAKAVKAQKEAEKATEAAKKALEKATKGGGEK